MEEQTFTVAGLSERAGAAIRSAFAGDVWVKGEIRDLSRPASGHVYFSLVDGPEDGDSSAMLPVTLFAADRRTVNRLLLRSGAVRMVDGVEVRIRGTVTCDPPRST
ncbi:MAG: exodeoxyribonuclease VII large subunit, partial [Acidimicrobiia bacterium]